MRALELDFLPPRHTSMVAFALLGTAFVLIVHAALRYQELAHDIAAKEARLARGAPRAEAKASMRPVSAEEYAFARQTAWRLALPWERLFGGLEAAAIKHVALLAIEPDVENRTVTISGEARDYLATLSYVAALAEQRDAFRGVYLQRHELRAGGSAPVAFSVSATWADKR